MEVLLKWLFGVGWKEWTVIFFSGLIGFSYNMWALGYYYVTDSLRVMDLARLDWRVMMSDQFLPILLQGWLLSAIFIGIPVVLISNYKFRGE